MDIQWFLKSLCGEAEYSINKPLFRLGRHREHDIVCSSVVISREHANFIVESNKLYLKDLGSANGTYINGLRIEEQTELHRGDIVSFGLPNHLSPCPPHGCFIYKVNSPINLTEDIILLLEEDQVKKEMPNKQLEETENNTNCVSTHNYGTNAIEMDDIIHIKTELVEEQDKNTNKNMEGGYSIEDNVIVIDDDVENINELSASQLFPLNDPYLRIKHELSEYDAINEVPPITIDSDDGDFDIFDILNDASLTNSPNSPLLGQQKLEKDTTLVTHKSPNDDLDRDSNHALAMGESNSKISSLGNEEVSANNTKHNVLNSLNTKLKNQCANNALGGSRSRYMKPPIIEPPILNNLRSKTKENNKPVLKRQNSSLGKGNKNKKQRSRGNIYESPPSTSNSVSRSKSNILTKEDKLKIKEKRKMKLKEISKQTKDDSSRHSKRLSGSKPCVKVSKNRGDFMLADTPSTNTRKRTSTVSTLPKKKSENKPFTSLKPQSSLMPPTSEPTTSSDPRLTRTGRVNAITSNCLTSTVCVSKPSVLLEVEGKGRDRIHNGHINSAKQVGRDPNVPVYISTLIENKQSFNDILTILNWRTQWLEEQKRCSTYPPLTKRPAIKMCDKFASHIDYSNVVIPLLLIELWNELFEDWVSIDTQEKQNQRKFTCVIEEVEVNPFHFVLKCTAYITRQQNISKQYIKENNIVLVHVPMQRDDQLMYQSLFGYVTKCEKRLIKGNDLVDECLLMQLRPLVPESLLHFDIVVKPIANKICLNKCMDGAMLLSLVSSFREIDAVNNLKNSSLCNFILDPKVEHYIIPNGFKSIENTNDKLTEMQERVVWEATQLCLSDAPGIYLVQGPPGTGKTTVIKNIVKNITLNNSGKKIRLLLTAPSNSAIDGLALKIIKELKGRLSDNEKKKIKLVRLGPYHAVNEEMRPYLLDQFSKAEVRKTFIADHPEAKKDFDAICVKRNSLKSKIKRAKELGSSDIKGLNEELSLIENQYESFAKNYMRQEYQKAFDNAKRRVYDGSNIVCTTLSSCVRLKEINTSTVIDCCIVDEATQSKETETLIPLMLGVSKLILVGDPQQLPAVTTSQHAKHLNFGQSLFQRIKKNFSDQSVNPIRMLNVQHRMHPDISLFPNIAFYKSEIKDSERCSLLQNNFNIVPYYVFNLNLKQGQENIHNINREEIDFTQKLMEAINSIVVHKKLRRLCIGIITPYNSQREALNNMIESCSFPATVSITVNTVDSFQGLEKDIIILSCVRYRPNTFLSDEQRLNVALTRAKHALYIVGTYSLFKNCTLLNRLRADAQRRKLYVNISSTSTTSLKEIIKC